MIRHLHYCVCEFIKDQALMDERERMELTGGTDTGPLGWREGTATAKRYWTGQPNDGL